MREYSFKLDKKGFNDNRLIFILFNENKKNNIIYENLDFIKKKLKLVLLPNIKLNDFVSEFIYGFDFNEDLYKIYITVIDKKTGLETIYGEEFNKDIIIPRLYIEKHINQNNMIKKYDFLNKYKKYINFKNFDNYYERTKNNKIDSIHIKYNIDLKLYNLKLLFEKLCNHLGWNSKKVLDFFEKNKNEDFYVNIIGLSENSINLYFNKKLN